MSAWKYLVVVGKPGLAAQTMEIDEAVGGGGQLIDLPEDADEPKPNIGLNPIIVQPDVEPDAAKDLEDLDYDVQEADG